MQLKLGYSKSKPRVYNNIQLTQCLVKNTIIMNTFNMTYSLDECGFIHKRGYIPI